MEISGRILSLMMGASVAGLALCDAAKAQETIKLGLSTALSGAGAIFGTGSEFMCKKAAREIAAAGGVKVGGKTYNFECLAYDNKYTAAEGTRVAQTLLNRDGVKFISGAFGAAPVQALQALAERQGVIVFTSAWSVSIKGPKFPLTFTECNTLVEIVPPLARFVLKAHPGVKTVAILNTNDATGKETEAISRKEWEKSGIKVLSSDFYERGTTEFQPLALRIASLKPDMVDLGANPPPDAGAVFRELSVLGWSGVKVMPGGSGADGLKATGGAAVEGVYMGAALTFEGPNVSEHQKSVNNEARTAIGESLNTTHVGNYDAVYAIKAGIEKAQSVDPIQVARILPSVKFRTFYGGEARFGGEETYGSPQQMLLPVLITQIKQGSPIELARISPAGL